MKHADEIVVNVRNLTEATGLDAHEGIELLKLFRYTTRADLGRMIEGICTRDLQEVYWRAHSIKGAALNLSLDAIASAAAAVEDCARAGDTDRLTFFFDALLGRFDSVIRFLEDRCA
jgi:HPt (histidine-containing phosphotransfer) domain-containing protein